MLRCGYITEQFIINIANSCHNLSYLSVSKCPNRTNSSIINRRSLNTSKCPNTTDIWVNKIAECYHKIESLYISDCAAVTDKESIELAEPGHSIKSLDMSCCIALTDMIICKLAYWQNIESLSISGCNQFTDVGFINFAENC